MYAAVPSCLRSVIFIQFNARSSTSSYLMRRTSLKLMSSYTLRLAICRLLTAGMRIQKSLC